MAINPSAFLRQENARLKQENEDLTEEIQALREFVEALIELKQASIQLTDDAKLLPLLRSILAKALIVLNAPDGSLLLLDDEANELEFVVVHGAVENDLIGYRIPADQGIAGWVVTNSKTALVRDVRRDQRFSHLVDEQFKFSTQSIAASPIIGDQKLYGLIEVLNQSGQQPFSETDAALLELLCWAAGEALALIERRNPKP